MYLLYLCWQEAEPGVREEDVARLVSLGYSEAMVRVALTNEDNSLERAAEALAANNGIVEHQVVLRSFFSFFLANPFVMFWEMYLEEVIWQLGVLPVPIIIIFLDCFFISRSCLIF
jgi:hypothetical protein